MNMADFMGEWIMISGMGFEITQGILIYNWYPIREAGTAIAW